MGKGDGHGSLGAEFKEWGHPFDEITKWRSCYCSNEFFVLPES